MVFETYLRKEIFAQENEAVLIFISSGIDIYNI